MSRPTLKMTHGAIGEAMCCYTDGSYKDADIALTEYENSIRADERAKVVKEIGNECSNKDLNENIDWCIQTLSLFDVTDLNKKELCETLESQKAMIVMHDKEVRNKAIDEFVKSLFANEVIDKSVVRRVAEQMKESE